MDLIRTATASPDVPHLSVRVNDEQGPFEQTGRALDLAISGPGYFRVRHGEEILFSRQGRFSRDANGAVVTPHGSVLQQAEGGDLIVTGEVTVARDGTVLADGLPIGRIALDRPADGTRLTPVGDSYFSAGGEDRMEEATGSGVRSGMVESSNVRLAEEMTQSMAALRQAESGARLIQLYDELMGRAASAFGQGGGR